MIIKTIFILVTVFFITSITAIDAKNISRRSIGTIPEDPPQSELCENLTEALYNWSLTNQTEVACLNLNVVAKRSLNEKCTNMTEEIREILFSALNKCVREIKVLDEVYKNSILDYHKRPTPPYVPQKLPPNLGNVLKCCVFLYLSFLFLVIVILC